MAFKPRVDLTGESGNVFAMTGKVIEVLERHGMHFEAKQFFSKVEAIDTYDEVLTLVREYVDPILD